MFVILVVILVLFLLGKGKVVWSNLYVVRVKLNCGDECMILVGLFLKKVWKFFFF